MRSESGQPDFQQPLTLEHGCLQPRAIWTPTRLNGCLDPPYILDWNWDEDRGTHVPDRTRKHDPSAALRHRPDQAQEP